MLGWLLHNMGRPVTSLRYEDLLANPKLELENILKFIHIPYSREQLDLVVKEGYSEYRRPQRAMFEHYTDKQKALVKDVVLKTIRALSHLQLNWTGYLEP